MEILMEDLESANLSWVHDVLVQEGETKLIGLTKFFKLIVANPEPMKAAPVADTVANLVLDQVTDSALEDVKQRLLNNPSLAPFQDSIARGVWYRHSIEATSLRRCISFEVEQSHHLDHASARPCWLLRTDALVWRDVESWCVRSFKAPRPLLGAWAIHDRARSCHSSCIWS
jgi:hypothetical protein